MHYYLMKVKETYAWNEPKYPTYTRYLYTTLELETENAEEALNYAELLCEKPNIWIIQYGGYLGPAPGLVSVELVELKEINIVRDIPLK